MTEIPAKLEILAESYYDLIRTKKFDKARKFLAEQDEETVSYIINRRRKGIYAYDDKSRDSYKELMAFLKDLERRTIN